jgi:hypothetical protein
LFNGHDHSGWYFDNPEKASSWTVKDGCLVNKSAGSNIATERKFTDFKLHVEVNCPSNANSGIYLRGRYEVQVEDDSFDEPPNHRMVQSMVFSRRNRSNRDSQTFGKHSTSR